MTTTEAQSNEEQVEVFYTPGFQMLSESSRECVFPFEARLSDGGMFHSRGITKRELFAAMAMQGFCANPAVFAPNSQNGWELVNATRAQLAGECLDCADALIAALLVTEAK